MRKISFYSLHHGNKAILHDGYADNHFWYYKAGSRWFAIYPESGTAVAIERTRKAACERAEARLEQVALFYNTHSELIDAFNTAFRKAIFNEQ